MMVIHLTSAGFYTSYPPRESMRQNRVHLNSSGISRLRTPEIPGEFK